MLECNGTCDHLNRIESKVDKIIDMQTEIKVDLTKIKKDVDVNTRDLTEHKEGVIQNRKRIAKLERPAVAMDYLKNIAIWISSVIGVVVLLKSLNIF